MMKGMDVQKLSRSQDGESWCGMGWSGGRVGRGVVQRCSYISLFPFHFGQPWMPSCRVLVAAEQPADPIDLFLKQLRAKGPAQRSWNARSGRIGNNATADRVFRQSLT